jgi:hypothetical protein
LQRIAAAEYMVNTMTQAMPKLLAIHPMDPLEPDEEVMLTEHSFLSAYNAYADVPGYMRWLDSQDQSPMYRQLYRFLQYLQWQQRLRGLEGKRWLLKAPHHLLRMDVLLQVFPGVRVIQTHRDPLQSIPSIASFIHTLRAVYSECADPIAAGHEWSDIMRRALAHTMSVRVHAPQQFLDVQFADTVQHPMEVVHRIYQWLGLSLADSASQAMRAWLQADEKNHIGGHVYDLEAYGLTEEKIAQDFASYRKHYIS